MGRWEGSYTVRLNFNKFGDKHQINLGVTVEVEGEFYANKKRRGKIHDLVDVAASRKKRVHVVSEKRTDFMNLN